MDFVTEQDFREIFALAVVAKAAKRHEEDMARFNEDMDHRKVVQHKAAEKEEKEREQQEKMATAEQIAAFEHRLDDYDTKTVDALMENGEALDRLGKELRQMEENAYVLPDGRRVFKTEDGQHVFDERGAEIGHGTVDPQIIEGNHTTWESFKAAKDAKDKLETERHGLLEFQSKVDAARARADGGDLSKKDLDALDADLKANAPPAVRRRLGLPTSENGNDARTQPVPVSIGAQAALLDDPSRRVAPQPAPM